MSFLRRNNNDDDQAAPPPPPSPGQAAPPTIGDTARTGPIAASQPAATQANDSGGGGGGIMGWLRDSYNGIYKIVLEPSMPTRSTVMLFVAGLLFGLAWAYLLFPTIFYGANPNRLNQPAQDQWVRMVAVGLENSGLQYPTETALEILGQVPNPQATIQSLIDSGNVPPQEVAALQSLLSVIPAEFQSANPVNPAPLLQEALVSLIVPALIIIIGFPIFLLLWRILIYPNIVAGMTDRFRQATNAEYREQKRVEAEARAAARAAKQARDNLVIQADSDLGEPVMKTISIFDTGRSYDDSFEIELAQDQGGDFLGQSGAALAEATDPDPVAIELWLFDMFASQNLKKVFVTEAGYNDASIRSRLEADVDNPAEDIKIARPGAKLTIDSDKLRLQGELDDLQIGGDGRFQHFQMKIAAWQKGATAVGAPPVPASAPAAAALPPMPSEPAGGRSMDEYDNIQFDPPPRMPASSPPPAGGRSMDAYDNIQFDPPPQMPASSPPPVGGRSMDEYDDIQFDPPPQMPGGQRNIPTMFEMDGYEDEGATTPMAPQGGGQRLTPPPLTPPPPSFDLPMDDDDDDDPFGGTGDFTPLPNR